MKAKQFRDIDIHRRKYSIVDSDWEILQSHTNKKSHKFKKGISLITRCSNREQQLETSLKSWVKYNFDEIIIVDWNSKGNVQAIIDKYQNNKIYRIQVPNQKKFSTVLSRNVGLKFARYETVLMIDCDLIMKNNLLFVRILNLKDNEIITCRNTMYHLGGTCIMKLEYFYQINGYNELLLGRKYDDSEFYKIAKKNGIKLKKQLDYKYFTHQPHNKTKKKEVIKNKKVFYSNKRHKVMQTFVTYITYPTGITKKVLL